MDLGETIQELRLKNNLSIKHLSEQVGLSSSMLSQIERGNANPSVSTLRSLATALHVPVYRFFLSDEDNVEYVVRKNERKTIAGTESSSFPLQLLTPTAITDIEFCLMTIPPYEMSSSNMVAHEGEEVSYVLKGTPILKTRHKSYNLNEGDSIYLPIRTKHVWENPTSEEIQVIYAVTPSGL